MIIKIIIVFKDSKEKLRLWLTLKIAKVTDIEKYNLYLYSTVAQLGEQLVEVRCALVRIQYSPFRGICGEG